VVVDFTTKEKKNGKKDILLAFARLDVLEIHARHAHLMLRMTSLSTNETSSSGSCSIMFRLVSSRRFSVTLSAGRISMKASALRSKAPATRPYKQSFTKPHF
jgi:hypothetical protein